MLFRKLNKLYKLKIRLYEALIMAKNSGADPEVIIIRTNDFFKISMLLKINLDFSTLKVPPALTNNFIKIESLLSITS